MHPGTTAFAPLAENKSNKIVRQTNFICLLVFPFDSQTGNAFRTEVIDIECYFSVTTHVSLYLLLSMLFEMYQNIGLGECNELLTGPFDTRDLKKLKCSLKSLIFW